MLKSYPEIFHKEEDGSFGVEFPGFCGGTEGDDGEEAMKNAREMLESSLAAYLDEGLELLKVADMSELSVENGFITLIQADPSPYLKSTKAIRKNVMVPEWLIRLADREHVNYSEVLTQTLEKKYSFKLL
ncbi:type II toxin-antitoxin system HicB family antitoxin [Streptococcus caballi]|uniref:type II toxin-antitoxin system HicB family antitoxin n=1 Tax=Streptococcus caballi TaxID=439220 RepID=UPI000362E10D|nr:type II toxin-antitoxin system HicB family antitoxin [Streptococcus caballi]